METYYSAKERRAQILQLLKSSPKILVSSLSQMFNISEVTIRKDLEELENRNLLIRVRGGAIRLPKLNKLRLRKKDFIIEKNEVSGAWRLH